MSQPTPLVRPSTWFRVALCFSVAVILWSVPVLWYLFSASSPVNMMDAKIGYGFALGLGFMLFVLFGLVFAIGAFRHMNRLLAKRPPP
jgi:hypothetical protein